MRAVKLTKITDATPKEWNQAAAAHYVDPYDMPADQPSSPADDVTHPPHYTNGVIETWDYIAGSQPDNGKGYFDGSVKKYMARWPYKNAPLKDLRKAKAFLDKLIEAELAHPTVIK
jgi:hypothetical protein|tara:strand:- start:1302 stop:1649 length:348 start_codon:yes stop_codon:yes gene_type:complete